MMITLAATDADTCELSFIIVTPPAHGSHSAPGDVACTGAGDTATLTYTPEADYAGADSLTFQVSDGTQTSSAAVAITVNPVNDAPVLTVPGASTASAGVPHPLPTSVEDVDAAASPVAVTLDTNENGTLSLGSTAGLTFTTGDGTDDGDLAFTGTLTDVNAALSGLTYKGATAGAATIDVTVDDQGATGSGGAKTDAETIAVTVEANVPPDITTSAGTAGFVENEAAVPIDTGLTVADPGGTLTGATVQITTGFAAAEDVLALPFPPVGITGTYDSGTGALTLTGTATVGSYETALRAVTYDNTSDNPSNALRTITFTVSDGASSDSDTRNLSVTPDNDAPVITSAATDPTFTEGGAAVTVDDQLQVADPDDTQLASGSVAIAAPVAGDVLTLADDAGDGITVAGSGTTSITLTGNDTLAAYREALRDAIYSSTSNTLVDGARGIGFKVNDGDEDSATFTRNVQITAVNTKPTVTTSAGDAAFTEGGAAVDVDPGVTASDEVGTLTRATVTIVSPEAQDALQWADPNAGDSIVLDAATTPTSVVLSGSGSLAEYEAALRDVQFTNPRTDLMSAVRQVSFVVRDEGLNSDPATRGVQITAVNSKPVVQTNAGAPGFTENGSAQIVAPNITVTDGDSPQLTAGTATITTPVAGDQLLWSDNNMADAITATGSGTTALSFTGNGTPAEYQAALAAVQFTHVGDNPTGVTRTVSFRVTDDLPQESDDVAASRKDVAVTVVNDVPVVNLDAPGALAYTEGDGFVDLFGASATITDADSATLDSLSVTISSGFDATFDQLELNTAGFTTDFTGGVLTITKAGGGTVAEFQTALRNVRFRNTDDDPDNRDDGTADPTDANRTVQVVADDSPDTSTPVSRNVTITPVNDAPSAPNPLPSTSGVRNTTIVSTASSDEPHVVRNVNLIGNSSDPDGLESAIQVVPTAPTATTQNGRITLNFGGFVRYEPPFSTSLTSDTYDYQVTDGSALSAPITFTVNLAGDVVYVADQSPAPEDGTAARPFDALADAVAVTGGRPIHIRGLPGDGRLTGGVTLTPNGKLLGEGVALTNVDVGSPTAETIFPAGTKPVLTSGGDTVVLASGGPSEVAGLTIDPDSTTRGISVFGANLTLRDMEVNDLGSVSTEAGIAGGLNGARLTFQGAVSVTMGRALDLVSANLSGAIASTTAGSVVLTDTTGGLTFRNLALINTGPSPALDLDNADNIDIDGAAFTTTVSTDGGPAVEATGLDSGSDLAFDTITVSGNPATGVNLDGTGNWTFSAGAASAIGATSQVGFDINGGNGTVSYSGTIANGTGRAVEVTGRSGDTTFLGNITGAGGTGINVANNTAGATVFSGATKTLNTASNAAVTLTNNTGHRVNFIGGGLDIDTTSGAGFDATGGGTVIVGTGANPNTIDTGSGRALNVAGTTIGPAGLTLRSISANGAPNGIVLTSTGNGPLLVTGDGSQTAGLFDRDGSGGTIQNTAGHSVLLSNANNVTLRQMNLSASAAGADLVNSTGGGGITLSAVNMVTPGRHGWLSTNLGGTNAFDHNSRVFNWQTSNSFGVYVQDPANGVDMTVDNAIFSTSVTGAAGFLFDNTDGVTNNGNVTITDSDFTAIDQNAAQINNDADGTITATIQRNNFHDADNTDVDGNNTLFLALAGGGQLNFTIGGPNPADGNTFTNLAKLTSTAGLVQVNAATTNQSGSTLNGTIQNNTISSPAAGFGFRRGIVIGIEANNSTHDDHNVLIADNTVDGTVSQGIIVTEVTVGPSTIANSNITISNNDVGLNEAIGSGGGDGGSAIEYERNFALGTDVATITGDLTVSGNVATSNNNSGVGSTLEIVNREVGGSNTSDLDATVIGNTLTQSNAAGEVFELLNSAAAAGPAGPDTCLDLNAANTSPNTATGGTGGFRLINNGGNYRIEGMAAGAQSAANVQAFLGARSTGGITTGGVDGTYVGQPTDC